MCQAWTQASAASSHVATSFRAATSLRSKLCSWVWRRVRAPLAGCGCRGGLCMAARFATLSFAVFRACG
ncbi:MAG: hypothetical protein Ta2A_04190 [Treponemataceae bacterium]|nr:MAG: hypothetical protein Ta2A_04190 [Treponemataceae bacterium]